MPSKGIKIEKSQKQKDLDEKKAKKNIKLEDIYELLLEIRKEQIKGQ